MKSEKYTKISWYGRLKIALSFSLSLFIISCADTTQVPRNIQLSFSGEQKINRSVELWISPELLRAKWDERMPFASNTAELGDGLAFYAEQTVRSLFTNVTVTRGESPIRASDVVLTLKLDNMNATKPVFAFNDIEYTLAIEWTATNRNNATLWQQAISGESKAPAGNVFTGHSNREEALGRLMQSVFQQSRTAMLQTPDLRRP